ncbi:hypothetical protein [Pedobacter sp. B4-66]|uniref:hypothetical protein n=1 Tax=Pedobacter sp. B4-66 TaxID=2817280 RepID=UPI001BD9AE47|nr:hypothetical protein [Pedobacter sp. B4-66]
MKQKLQVLFIAIAISIVGCGSKDHQRDAKDLLITDTVTIDTADMGAAPADTTAMNTGTMAKGQP